MMPQFGNSSIYRANAKDIAARLMMFAIGMFKKTIFADNIALVSNQIFADVVKVSSIDFLTAWQGALAYTLQIYFDFSGYSDMAIGLSLMMGVRLPINFNSPYKSGNIIEFWRRWHMTLSRFLKDYLYIPLGGNRFGANRRSLNLMATMLLGGLWHGAAWTFVVWGGLHGFYLLVNHSWRSRVHAVIGSKTVKSTAYVFLSSALTFLCVVFAWVPFRADSLDTATKMMWAMIGANGWPSFQQVGAWIVRLITSAPETLVGAAPWGLIPWLLLICLASAQLSATPWPLPAGSDDRFLCFAADNRAIGSPSWHHVRRHLYRPAELMRDLFGVKLVAASIAKMNRSCAKRLRTSRSGAQWRGGRADQAYGRDWFSHRL